MHRLKKLLFFFLNIFLTSSLFLFFSACDILQAIVENQAFTENSSMENPSLEDNSTASPPSQNNSENQETPPEQQEPSSKPALPEDEQPSGEPTPPKEEEPSGEPTPPEKEEPSGEPTPPEEEEPSGEPTPPEEEEPNGKPTPVIPTTIFSDTAITAGTYIVSSAPYDDCIRLTFTATADGTLTVTSTCEEAYVAIDGNSNYIAYGMASFSLSVKKGDVIVLLVSANGYEACDVSLIVDFSI